MRLVDLSGRRFFRLTVLARDTTHAPGTYWVCRCDCGRAHSVLAQNLVTGRVKSCGCWQTEARRHQRLDLSGHRYGRLLVLEPARRHRRSAWLCRCDCGTQVRGRNKPAPIRSCQKLRLLSTRPHHHEKHDARPERTRHVPCRGLPQKRAARNPPVRPGRTTAARALPCVRPGRMTSPRSFGIWANGHRDTRSNVSITTEAMNRATADGRRAANRVNIPPVSAG